MKRRSFIRTLITSTFVVLSTSSCGNTTKVTRKHKPFKPKVIKKRNMADFTVKNSKIYAPDGVEFVVKGTNINGLNWCWAREVTQDVDLITKVWGFNTVRVNCALLYTNNPNPQYKTNNDLDKIIQTFTSKKCVVMLEMHDHTSKYFTSTSNPSLKQLIDFYVPLAQKYKDNPYLWFNVQNEPGDVSEQWLTTHGEVLKAIRAVSNHIVVCDGASWGQDSSSWDGSNVQDSKSAILTYGQKLLTYGGGKYGNVVYSLHVYEQWNNNAYSKMADYMTRVNGKGLALIVGEFGSHNNNYDCLPGSRAVLQLGKERNLGRISWAWDGGDANDYCTNSQGGWAIDRKDGNKPANLSTLGSLVWDDNRLQTALSKLESTTTPTPAPTPSGTDGIDLVPVDVRVKPELWRKGTKINFELDVMNQGTKDLVGVAMGHSFEVDGKQVDFSWAQIDIPAGKTATYSSNNGWVATSSTIQLKAIVDDQNKVTEGKENNNFLVKLID